MGIYNPRDPSLYMIKRGEAVFLMNFVQKDQSPGPMSKDHSLSEHHVAFGEHDFSTDDAEMNHTSHQTRLGQLALEGYQLFCTRN